MKKKEVIKRFHTTVNLIKQSSHNLGIQTDNVSEVTKSANC